MKNNTCSYISKEDLKEIEIFADNLFDKLNIDIVFTNHFYYRLNDSRNGKQISVQELKETFQDIFLNIGDKLTQMKIDTEAVINDVSNNLNIPFILVYDKRNHEVDLVSKTIMRKKDFRTSSKKFSI